MVGEVFGDAQGPDLGQPRLVRQRHAVHGGGTRRGLFDPGADRRGFQHHGPVAGEPRRGELFRQLLEFNARDLVHGSYGLEGDHVVLTDTLDLENLDYSEFESSFDSITLALASHLGALAPFRE